MPQCSEIKDVCISQGLNAEIEVRYSCNVLIFKNVHVPGLGSNTFNSI